MEITDFATTYYVISAHYDTIWKEPEGYAYARREQPGADDNAVGVAAMLEIARVLSTMDLDTTIKFIAFSGEEQVFQGSWAYLHNLDGSDGNFDAKITGLSGAINLDMFGYKSQGGASLCFRELPGSLFPDHSLTESIKNANLAHARLNLFEEINMGHSDHNSFWQFYQQDQSRIPAVGILPVFGDGGVESPFFHSSGDKIEHLDLDFISNMVRIVGISVYNLMEG